MSLKEELDRQREISHRRIPEDKWQLMQDAAQDLTESGMAETMSERWGSGAGF